MTSIPALPAGLGAGPGLDLSALGRMPQSVGRAASAAAGLWVRRLAAVTRSQLLTPVLAKTQPGIMLSSDESSPRHRFSASGERIGPFVPEARLPSDPAEPPGGPEPAQRGIALPPGAPPESVWPRHLFETGPYRPLPPADTMADGRFLEPRVGIYGHNEMFCRMMGGASEMAAAEFGRLLAHGPVTPAQVGAVMDTIAMVRQAVARQSGDAVSGFGMRVPPDTMPFDVISPDATHRHAPYFARAQEWAAHAGADEQEALRQRQMLTLETDGVRLTAPLSHPNQEGKLILIHHPGGQEAMPLRAHALHLFAEVLNTPDMPEQEAMRRLGRAHYLLMQGVPYARGAPSIVETLNDATMRARYGVTFPPKRENVEPFWEAMFTPGVLIDLYAERFRELYE